MVSTDERPRIRILRPTELSGHTYELESGTSFIGRQKTNTIVLKDSLVSRKHAQILFDGDAAVIEDLGGKNPIRVNGDNVKSQTLNHGDRVLIGQTELVFEYPGRSPVHSLEVVRDDTVFEDSDGNISVNAETIPFEPIDLQSLPMAEKVYGRLSRLYRFSEEVLSIEDEDSLFELLLNVATQETAAERGFLSLAPALSEGPLTSINVVKFWDLEQGERAQSIQMSETIFNHILQQRAAVLIRDLPKCEDFGMSVIDLQIRSFICAPMVLGDDFLGLVYVDTRSQRDQFDRSDLEFVSAIARLASLALQSHRSQVKLRDENTRLRQVGSGSGALVGNHPKMVEIFRIIEKVASRDTSVLVLGENGTGKELIARAFHDRSTRKDGPFVAVNCGAIPPNLVESELFGYEKGAFTGANQRTEGKFEQANGGTLFLDEIGDMPLDMQVKILRALQERKFYRVGGKDEIEVDIRVISATNQDLQALIEDGRFREDLYFRFAVVTIEVPALKDRGEDVLTIARQFVSSYAQEEDVSITKAAEDCLLKYHWPGNIRELRNVLEQAIILGDGKKISPQDLPPNISKTSRGKLSFQLKSLADMEKQYIFRVLEETGGNKTRAASILQISRETLHQKLKQYKTD